MKRGKMKVHSLKVMRIIAISVFGIALTTLLWVAPFGLFTVTASGFTFKQWNQINLGLTQEEVVACLGEPFERVEMEWNDDFPEVWYYSRKNSLNVLFRDYRVYFDKYQTVASKTRHIDF